MSLCHTQCLGWIQWVGVAMVPALFSGSDAGGGSLKTPSHTAGGKGLCPHGCLTQKCGYPLHHHILLHVHILFFANILLLKYLRKLNVWKYMDTTTSNAYRVVYYHTKYYGHEIFTIYGKVGGLNFVTSFCLYVLFARTYVQYASLHRFTMSSEQQEFVTWAWEVGLMLKLHPNQLLSRSMQTLSPTSEQHTQQCELHVIVNAILF